MVQINTAEQIQQYTQPVLTKLLEPGLKNNYVPLVAKFRSRRKIEAVFSALFSV